MISVIEVTSRLRTTRREFSFVFLRAQFDKDIPLGERIEFEAIGRNAIDKLAFEQALTYSELKGFFPNILRLVISSGLDDGSLLLYMSEHNTSENATLQSFTNVVKGMDDPVKFAQGINKGMRWTGKVMINGQPRGSGVLIGPKRFLTAWHVVREMFDVKVTAGGKLSYTEKKTPALLEIVFDDYLNYVEDQPIPNKIKKIKAAAKWCEAHCSCHKDEIQNGLPNLHTDLEGFWDYAVIRMSESLEKERHWATLEKRAVVPGNKAKIILFQYPGGGYLKMDDDLIMIPEPPDLAVPRIRFLHLSNATHASSGGPVFDKDFSLVGIHQGTWPVTVNNGLTNRGVPIINIIMDIESKALTNKNVGRQNAEDSLIWFIDKRKYTPVIGIDELQYLVIEMAVQSEGGVLRIKGKKGSGKTFCIQALSSLLGNGDHLKILLPAEVVSKMDPMTLSTFICSAAGAELTEVISLDAYSSTPSAWLRDELLNKVLSAIETSRIERKVWICFMNMNLFAFEDNNTMDFIYLLIEGVKRNSWLRLVIDGFEDELPLSLDGFYREYENKEKNEQDIVQYLNRFFDELPTPSDPAIIKAFAGLLFQQYNKGAKRNNDKAIKRLSDQCILLLGQFLDKITK